MYKRQVSTDGSINLPENGSVDITDADGEKTTVTTPNTGGTVGTDENGNITVPDGSTVQTENGTEITLPGGGTVDPETGAVTPDEDGSAIIEDSDGNTTTITPPNGGSVTPNDDGTVTVPDGSTIQTGDGTEDVYKRQPYAPAGTSELAQAASTAMADKRAGLLLRHGAITVGANLMEALYRRCV